MSTEIASSFIHFPKLPPELRIQIWRLALPEDVGDVMFTYHADCWNSQPDKDLPGMFTWTFHPDRLKHLSVKLPLASVSREACKPCHLWINRNGFKFSKQASSFTRPFNLHQDTIVVPYALYDNFAPRRRLGVTFSPNIYRVALPEIVLCRSFRLWIYIIQFMHKLRSISLIVDAPPELTTLDTDKLDIDAHWDLIPLPDGRLRWNADCSRIESARRFEYDLGLSTNHLDSATLKRHPELYEIEYQMVKVQKRES